MKYYKLPMIMLLSCLFACKTTAPDGIDGLAATKTIVEPIEIDPQKALENEKIYRAARFYLNGINTDVDYPKAFEHFNYLAKQGDPQGFNGIAGMYRQGMGIEQDQRKARQYYEMASEMGLGKASYNLAHMYRTAQGGKQDFKKTFEYARKAYKQHYKPAAHLLGFLYYKGFGTKQDYAKAVKYFEESAAREQSSSMYFLGLCYMGGYGVEKDIEKGKQLIEQAAQAGNDHAVDFIAGNMKEQYENPKMADKDGKAYPAYRKIKNDAGINLNGVWTGRILQYDWGKQTVIEEHSLDLQISDNDGVLSGYWLQSDSIAIELNATRKDGFYQLENMQYLQIWAITWDLKRLRFTKETDAQGDTILYANLIQFSPQTTEPASPLMLELKRSRLNSVQETQSGNTHFLNTAERLWAYPNPFTDKLTIEFTTRKAGQYSILLHDLSGRLIHAETVNIETPRAISALNTASLPAGTYSVNVRGNGVNVSTLVIKHKN